MANYEDLLKKNKKRLTTMKSEPKRLERKGAVRPWQVDNTDSSLEVSISPEERAKVTPSLTPTLTIKTAINRNFEESENSEQLRNSYETKSEQSKINASDFSEQFRNSSGTQDRNSINESDQFRNSSVTKSEQQEGELLANKELLRNSSETISRPNSADIRQIRSAQSENSIGKGNKVSEQQFRNSYGTNSEQDKKVSEIRNNLVTGTGTVTEQINVYSLPRFENKIMSALVGICVNTGNTITPQLTYEKLSDLSGVPLESAKTLVKRLEKKGFLKRLEGRRGPGAWTIIEIPIATYQAFITYSQRTLALQSQSPYFNSSGTNNGTSKGTGLGTDVSSSSNNIINNNTTNTGEGERWKEIKIPTVLEECGFTNTHAKQVLSDKENKLSFEEVQESFDNFAFDVENNKITVRTNHVSYLMSVLRSQRIAYVSLYQKEQERLQLEDYLKELKKEEELKKMKLQMELSQKFAEWLKSKSQAEKNQIVPPTGVVSEGSQIQENLLKAYFCKENGISID